MPLWIYQTGRFELVLAALLLGAIALGHSLRRRPLIQRRRAWPAVALAFTIGIAPFPVPYPAVREGRPCSQSLDLPVRGTWRVRWGGEGVEANPLVLEPSRRFALVLVAEEEGRSVSGDPRESRSHPSFGRPVYAPAAGEILHIEESLPDGPDRPVGGDLGNHLVLALDSGEYLWLSGLQQGSVLEEAGTRVDKGRELARVGWSAAPRPTSEPHLCLFLTNHADRARAEGVPMLLSPHLEDGVRQEGPPPKGGVDLDGSQRGALLSAL